MAFQLDPLIILAILGLVNFTKSFGLEGKALTIVSMLIGLVISVLVQILPADVIRIGLVGILSGLGASGFYDFGNLLGARSGRQA